MQRTEIPKQAL